MYNASILPWLLVFLTYSVLYFHELGHLFLAKKYALNAHMIWYKIKNVPIFPHKVRYQYDADIDFTNQSKIITSGGIIVGFIPEVLICYISYFILDDVIFTAVSLIAYLGACSTDIKKLIKITAVQRDGI